MRRYGPLIVLALTVGACSDDGGESGLVAAAALILPATWLRRRFAPDDDEDDWDWDEND